MSGIIDILRHLTWIEVNGYVASAAVLATFLMPTMIPLRIVALCSNVLFMSYAYFDSLYPVLILHGLLFPINLIRLLQFRALINDVRKAQSDEFPIGKLSAHIDGNLPLRLQDL